VFGVARRGNRNAAKPRGAVEGGADVLLGIRQRLQRDLQRTSRFQAIDIVQQPRDDQLVLAVATLRYIALKDRIKTRFLCFTAFDAGYFTILGCQVFSSGSSPQTP